MYLTRTGVLVKPSDIPGDIIHVSNPGVHSQEEEKDKSFLLLCRVVNSEGISGIQRAFLDHNYQITAVDQEPVLKGCGPCETLGCEDGRLTEIEGVHYLAYTSAYQTNGGPWQSQISLASTTDLEHFERLGTILAELPRVKNGLIHSATISRQFGIYYRPWHPRDQIWGAYSVNLTDWYGARPVMSGRKGWWDGHHLGPGAPSIKTDDGWLSFYHGVDDSNTYHIGLALFDPDDPFKLLARSLHPLISPLKPYEKFGRVPNVVFTCGAALVNDTVVIFYGAADHCIAAAEIPLKKSFHQLKTVKPSYRVHWPR